MPLEDFIELEPGLDSSQFKNLYKFILDGGSKYSDSGLKQLQQDVIRFLTTGNIQLAIMGAISII